MINDINDPLRNHLGGVWLQRAVGAIALVVGLALGGLLSTGVFKLATGDRAGMTGALLTFLAIVAGLTAFFVSVGWRLTSNRPNRHGSLLTPGLWFILAFLFLVCAVAAAGLLLSAGRFADLEVAGYALAFSVLAAMAGRRAMKNHGIKAGRA
jgi:uncharacterized membrane protein YidH (DUF202 family)